MSIRSQNLSYEMSLLILIVILCHDMTFWCDLAHKFHALNLKSDLIGPQLNTNKAYLPTKFYRYMHTILPKFYLSWMHTYDHRGQLILAWLWELFISIVLPATSPADLDNFKATLSYVSIITVRDPLSVTAPVAMLAIPVLSVWCKAPLVIWPESYH